MQNTNYGPKIYNDESIKVTLKNTVHIPAGKKIYCQTCSQKLYRCSKPISGFYDTCENSISLSRMINFPHAPYFFCRKCWDSNIQPKIYNLIIQEQQQNNQNSS